MPDQSFSYAVALVSKSANMTAGDATRLMFDQYRAGSQEVQEAIVLALVAEVATLRLCRDQPFVLNNRGLLP